MLSPSQARQAYLSCCVRRRPLPDSRAAAPSVRYAYAAAAMEGEEDGKSAMEVEKAKCDALDRHVAFARVAMEGSDVPQRPPRGRGAAALAPTAPIAHRVHCLPRPPRLSLLL